MKSPLYHGKTIIKEMGKDHPIDLHLEDMGGRMFDAHNVFPEYFIISVPLFDDVIKQELDEWLYVMKNSETREDFKSPYMLKVAERLNVLKMSDKELRAYSEYRNKSLKERDYLVSAEEKGIEKGLEKVARNMLARKKPISEIAEDTGLTIDQIRRLTGESK